MSRHHDYLAERHAEARRIVANADLCAARPVLRRIAWQVLTRPEAAPLLRLGKFRDAAGWRPAADPAPEPAA